MLKVLVWQQLLTAPKAEEQIYQYATSKVYSPYIKGSCTLNWKEIGAVVSRKGWKSCRRLLTPVHDNSLWPMASMPKST